MILMQPSKIAKIDKFATEVLGIPARELMLRAAHAVANAVKENVPTGGTVRIFSGKGNNGGDGYAAATLLMKDYDVVVYDVFGAGQKSDEGCYFLEKFLSLRGRVEVLFDVFTVRSDVEECDCIIDAIFGTGFVGEYPRVATDLAEIFSSSKASFKLAIDVPLGVDASLGCVSKATAYHADATVALGFVKPGLVSYPAKEYIGKLIYDNIGLHNDDILSNFESHEYYIDSDIASRLLPRRPDNSNKGTFGKLLNVTGSSDFPGAAHLSLEASLRGGVGCVTYLGEKELCASLLSTFPEAIYKPLSLRNGDIAKTVDILVELSLGHSATLIGSGSSRCEGVRLALESLLATDASPLILDADAINLLSELPDRGREMIRRSPRQVILTPHPLEFSRISGISTEEIQQNRLAVAKEFAREYECILVLKGAATVVTDGVTTYVNSSGSSALAKAGSGDVLAGVLSSLVASGLDPLSASALAVYFHGIAADVLSLEYSAIGVTPSDLPREIARQIAKTINHTPC